jgi:type VI secretion system protein ImpM
MPSVDRVGRYFPFTVLRPLDVVPGSAPDMAALWQWLDRLDELAGDAMQDDWTVDRLEAELARMAAPLHEPVAPVPTYTDAADAARGASAAAHGQMTAVPLPVGGDAAAALDQQAQALWRQQAAGRAFWYARTAQGGHHFQQSQGLPAPRGLAALLGAAP